VIFVFDIEKCMKRLDPFSQDLLNRIALQEYTQGEAAELVGQSLRSIVRKYAEALDRLTAIFLEVDLLSVAPPRGCQERG
jgi:DNA-directed RNA polymerase specialized sigma24 family protein